ncbi:MAG: hypothetical protein EB020_07930, partial [Proteobacteria bacterium]|nr:hypothetical protein [Pseudomonadota bacterium]
MRQGLLEARIRELESKLRHVALIEDQDNDGATIGVGSRVKLREIATDDEVEYQVVGPEETDPRLGKISHRSPVGKALIGKTADTLNLRAWVVGGFVRDSILKRENKDIDIVVVGNGVDFAQAVAKQFNNDCSLSVFRNFGTAQIKFDDWIIEFIGARKESYRRDSRKPVVENGTLEDDQNRRDFTINAMYLSLNSDSYGELYDPFNGVQDLQNGIIRTCNNPDITFDDDPLRMLRAIRFASRLNFRIELKTFEAIKQNVNRIEIVSQERITDELNGMILGTKPSRAFEMMSKTGLLSLIFPEMMALHGVETRNGKSHKDNFYHTLQVLDNICELTDNLWLRWAAIL